MSGHILKSTLLAVLGKTAETRAVEKAPRRWQPRDHAAIVLPAVVIGLILLCAIAPGWVALRAIGDG